MYNEIGGEFWINKIEETKNIHSVPEWINKFGNSVLTSSGRGAISLLLSDVNVKKKLLYFQPIFVIRSFLHLKNKGTAVIFMILIQT